jgi:hypothetical protein
MTQSTVSIDVKTAIRKAREYFLDVYEGVELPNFLLEEVQVSEDDRHWLITFGFDTDREAIVNPMALTLYGTQPKFVREYKTVRLDRVTGSAIDMVIRPL